MTEFFGLIWKTKAKPAKIDRYQEIVAIKDRLYADMVRLETLVGHKIAADTLATVQNELGLVR